MMKIRVDFALAALLFAPALITGCGKGGDGRKATPATTQVAVRVNGDEITVHQINYFLARSRNVTPGASDRARREILDKLIDQHLARQKAIESKLDRSPEVVQALEAARNEILARAYLEKLTAALPRPAQWETLKYYLEHPELFAQRRTFDLEEFVFVAQREVAASAREQLPKARSLQEAADWLRSRGVNFIANYGVRSAEQVPFEILRGVQAMRPGQVRLFEAGGGRFHVIRLVAFKEDPMDEATATPRIQQFLLNQRSSEVVAREMKQLRERSRVEFVGEFAAGTAAGEATANAGAGEQTPAAAPARAKREDRPASEAPSGDPLKK